MRDVGGRRVPRARRARPSRRRCRCRRCARTAPARGRRRRAASRESPSHRRRAASRPPSRRSRGGEPRSCGRAAAARERGWDGRRLDRRVRAPGSERLSVAIAVPVAQITVGLDGVEDLRVARCSGTGCRQAPRRSSSRSASGWRSRYHLAVRIIPGVQNPHCEPAWSRNACWRRCSSPSAASPRTVVISQPSAWTANIRHAFTGSPSSRTVQVPQTPSPQPSLTSGAPASVRSSSSSERLGLTLSLVGRPLIVTRDRVLRRRGHAATRSPARRVAAHPSAAPRSARATSTAVISRR